MATRFRIKDHWAEQRMFLRRSIAAGVIVLALMAVLVVRLMHLQLIRYDYYTELSQGNRVHLEPVPPNRGLILDRHGKILAENLPAYQLELTAEQVPNIDAALARLTALGLVEKDDIARLKRLIRSHRTYEGVPLRLQLSDEEVARFAVRRHDFSGIDIKTRLRRHYPLGELAVHALGYVSAISEQDLAKIDASEYLGTSLIGKLGIEASYESELHGTPGYRQVLVNAQGRPVESGSALQRGLSSKAASAGNDLLLSLDIGVQRVAEEALGSQRGAVVAVDPNNGDVLVFVSKPGFDPNRFGRGLTVAEYNELQNNIDRPLFNRALRGTYPPGSTVKPSIALAALVYGMVNPAQQRYCIGRWYMPGVSRPWREGRGGVHGYVDLREAVGRSCDVYFYGLANTLGVDRIASFLEPFGFGSLTGIDIPGEKPGVLPSRAWKKKAFSRPAEQMWFPGETVNFGIGQGYMTVTPLQLAQVAALLAGRGHAFRLRLATGVRDAKTGEVRKFPVKPLTKVQATPEQWRIVMEGMEQTMKGQGTATRSGANAGYSIAGKTGTAQVFSLGINEKYDEKNVDERLRDHSWFIAFAPVEQPRIALAVLVENGGGGARAAAPLARKVMDAYLLPQNTAEQTSPDTPAATAGEPLE